MSKRTVHYIALITRPVVGLQCHLLPYDHPNCTNQGKPAITSPVTNTDNFEKTGIFETENSIYIRSKFPSLDKTDCKEG